MKQLRNMLIAAIAIVSFSVSAQADSQNARGLYFGVSGSAMGVELDGSYTDAKGVITKGKGGAIESTPAIDLGYNWAMGDRFYVGFGLSHTPGKANIGKADDAADAADITLEADNFMNYYIAPALMVSESTSLFVKWGQSKADLKVTGNFTGAAANELSGDSLSFGSSTFFSSGMYISTEAGMTDYDKITVKDIGNASDAGTGDASASPTLAFGTVTIGYKF